MNKLEQSLKAQEQIIETKLEEIQRLAKGAKMPDEARKTIEELLTFSKEIHKKYGEAMTAAARLSANNFRTLEILSEVVDICEAFTKKENLSEREEEFATSVMKKLMEAVQC